jgi:hypothetical protein
MPLELRIDDVVRLRKVHPCGSYDWRVVRLGADIGLRCLKCNHRVLMERRQLEKRLKSFVSRGEPVDPAIEQLLFGDRQEEA